MYALHSQLLRSSVISFSMALYCCTYGLGDPMMKGMRNRPTGEVMWWCFEVSVMSVRHATDDVWYNVIWCDILYLRVCTSMLAVDHNRPLSQLRYKPHVTHQQFGRCDVVSYKHTTTCSLTCGDWEMFVTHGQRGPSNDTEEERQYVMKWCYEVNVEKWDICSSEWRGWEIGLIRRGGGGEGAGKKGK